MFVMVNMYVLSGGFMTQKRLAELAIKFSLGDVYLFHKPCGKESYIVERIVGLNESHLVICSKCSAQFLLNEGQILARVPIVGAHILRVEELQLKIPE